MDGRGAECEGEGEGKGGRGKVEEKRGKMGVYIAHARKIGRQLRKQKQMKGNKRRRRGARGADKENDGQGR